MKWITRERPKIDRLACPWLIKRFIDEQAEIIYVPFDQVIKQAKKLNATPLIFRMLNLRTTAGNAHLITS